MTSTTLSEAKTAVSIKSRLQQAIDLKTLLGGLVLFALFTACFAFVQYGTSGLPGNDGYYHIKMGWLIRQQGIKPDFTWLPFTILSPEAYYDHHLLYHIYLSLFAAVDPAVDGGLALTQSAKVASIILPSLAFMVIWWVLREQDVPWASLWAVGLFAVSEAFLYRMSMPRAQSASLLVLALWLLWLLQGRFKLLIPLGFAYVWFYNAFPLLIVMGGVYVIAAYLIERKFYWQALLYPTIGIALGIIINPYFPENAVFIWSHLLPKFGDTTQQVGNEWFPYRTWTIVENSGFALGVFVLGAFAMGWRDKRMDKPTLVTFALAILFGLMLFKSRRFVEYFPAFALIFGAISTAPILRDWLAEWEVKRPLRVTLFPLALVLILAFPLQQTLRDGRELVSNSKPADQYAAAALYLGKLTTPETMVFQTDWDDFTRLFFYNTNAIYTAGLDPTYMELADKALYDEWVDITRGRVEMPGEAIRDTFGASYVFSDLKHERFIENAAADPLLEEIYRDDYAIIFAVHNQ